MAIYPFTELLTNRSVAYGNDLGHCGGGSAIGLRIMIAFLSLHGNGVCCVTDLIVDLMVMVMISAFLYIYILGVFFVD